MLGAGIDARLGLQDYSGFTNAAAIQAQGMQNLGASIGDLGKQFGEYKKQQAEDERMIQKSESVAKSISDLIPDLQPTMNQSLMILGDKNIPLNRRKAEAEAIDDILRLGTAEVKGRQEARAASQKALMESREVVGIENILRGNETVQMAKMGDGTLRPIADVVQQYGEPLAPLPQEYMTQADELGTPVDMGVSADGGPGVLPPRAQLGVGPRFKDETATAGSTFRAANPEEAARYGAVAGQIEELTGRFYPIQPPTGMSVRTTPEGGVELIQGPGVTGQTAKEQRVEEAQKRMGFENTRAITTALSQAIPLIEANLSANPFMAKGQAAAASMLPASTAGRIDSMLETARVTTSREVVNSFRNASLTGSAGGQITEKEWPKFENRMGKMEIGMNPRDLVNNAKLTGLNQFEAAHGTPNDVLKLLDEGKITQDVFDQYTKEYLNVRNNLGIPMNGIELPGAEWTKLNPKLMTRAKGAQQQAPASQEASDINQRLQELRNKLSQ
jgi:hypothetical protein